MDEFYKLLDNVKTALKSGWPPEKLRYNLQKLHKILETKSKSKSIRAKDKFNYLKSKCLVAEAFDYLGDTEAAKRAVEEGGSESFEQLQRIDKFDDDDKRILRERVRLCLNYAHIVFYRGSDYDNAKNVILWCRDFVMDRLRDETDFPCFGTLAKAEYFLGRIYMRQNEHEQAETCFERAIHYYDKRAERMKAECKDEKKLQEELAFSEHKTGLCLGLGLGWNNFLQGRLKIALRNNVTPARVLLRRTEDALNCAYLDLLLGSIQRSLADRRDRDKLQEAIRRILGAETVFKQYGHGPYMARAAYELSLAYLYNNELDKAELAVAGAEAFSDKTQDRMWKCRSLIVRSRIDRLRRRYTQALEFAAEALRSARETNQVPYQIEALIAQGEALIMLEEIAKAREAFQQALTLNVEPGSDSEGKHSNPKLEAACRLHLARTYVRERMLREAQKQFDRWRELRGQIELGIVHEIAGEVEEEIKELNKDFVIRADENDLRYEKHKKALQHFLIERATRKGLSLQQMADALNISRQTLFQWQRTK